MDEFEALIEPLRAGLYEATKVDWFFSMSLILTEPVCPTIVICPEGYDITRYRYDAGEPLARALPPLVALVKTEVIDRKIAKDFAGLAPFSGCDDDNFATWLRERAMEGTNPPFPKAHA